MGEEQQFLKVYDVKMENIPWSSGSLGSHRLRR
jgi:hypothetical protein